MAYNLNPNQIYGRPVYGVQPRQVANQPAFGHQAGVAGPLYANSYSSGAYPVPYAGAQGQPPRAAYSAQPLKPSAYPVSAIPPLAALPNPGQIFTPSTPAGFNAPSGIGNTQNLPVTGMASPGGGKPPAEKPAVQNYYYTLPTGKTPPSRKKDLKKFLFVTGAVITGMITTAGLAIGALFVFAPNQFNFFRKLGARPFAWANQGLKAFKDTEGSFVRKALAGGKAVHTAVKKPPEQKNSLWTDIKLAYQKRFNPEAFKKYEAEQAKANQEQIKRPIMQQGDIAEFAQGIGSDDVNALKGLAQKFGFNLENQSIGSILAKTFNEADPKQIANVLKNMQGQAEGGKSFDMAGVIVKALSELEPDKLTKLVVGFLPEEKVKKLTANGAKLTDKDVIDKYIINTLSEAMAKTLDSETGRNYGQQMINAVLHQKLGNVPGLGRWFPKPPTEDVVKEAVEAATK